MVCQKDTHRQGLLHQIGAFAPLRQIQVAVQAQLLNVLITGVLRPLIQVRALPAAAPGQVKMVGKID